MKCTKLATIAMLVASGSAALAQDIRQPNSVTTPTYNYYLTSSQEDPSPSDAVPPAPNTGALQAPYGGDAKGGKGHGGKGHDCGSCYLFGCGEPFKLFPENCRGIDIGGWFQSGYHSQNTPRSVAPGDLLAFNDQPDRINMHQAWLYVGREADGSDGYWDFGFRMDLVYGTDAQKTQAFGGNGWDNGWDRGGGYGWAMPQLYLEAARGDLSVIMGHFFTIMGYESVTAPDNFFYSHSLTMFNSEPFTHTGVLATWQATPCMKWFMGYTLGWNTGFEQFADGNNYLGGFSWDVTDVLTFSYTTAIGDFGRRTAAANVADNASYAHSIILDAQLTDRLNYVFQQDLVAIGNADNQVGINQYLLYHYNDCVGLGTRVEWWKSGDVSQYEWTSGLNIRPHANLVIRPEVRYDWTPSTNFDQTTFGIDAIMTY